MNKANRSKLAERVARAAEASLAAQGFVSPLDILSGIGWVEASAAKR
jgi:hypothetical protein